MILKYAKFYSEVKRVKPKFVPTVELSMILHISYFPVSHTKNTEGVSLRSFKIETLTNANWLAKLRKQACYKRVGWVNCKHRVILITLQSSPAFLLCQFYLYYLLCSGINDRKSFVLPHPEGQLISSSSGNCERQRCVRRKLLHRVNFF